MQVEHHHQCAANHEGDDECGEQDRLQVGPGRALQVNTQEKAELHYQLHQPEAEHGVESLAARQHVEHHQSKGQQREQQGKPVPNIANPGANLSAREENVLRHTAQGLSNKEIGNRLEISTKTVETYKARAIEKLALRSRSEIVRYAARRGWLDGRGDA